MIELGDCREKVCEVRIFCCKGNCVFLVFNLVAFALVEKWLQVLWSFLRLRLRLRPLKWVLNRDSRLMLESLGSLELDNVFVWVLRVGDSQDRNEHT